MGEKKETLVIIQDTVDYIQDTGSVLKLLWNTSKMDSETSGDNYAFREVAEMILTRELKNLNRIMDNLSQEYESIKYEPIRIE